MRVAVNGGTEHLLYIHGFLESKAITMKINFSKCTWVFSLFAMTLFVSQAVMAQDEGRTKLDWGDWASGVSVGAGIRASYNSGDPIGATNDINIDNARLYVNATGHDILGLELNFDINNAQGFGAGTTESGEFRVLDAILKIEFGDLVNIWMGRMLPPSDRSNLSGPYYQNNWAFPYSQFGYYNIFQGRDDGVMVHGSFREGSIEYALGVYDGEDGTPSDEMMVAGRFSLNLLDNEEGYYNASTYHGTKELLTVGFAFQNQQDARAIGTDYDSYNFDLLYERPTSSGGVITLEGAYYSFAGTGTENDGHSYFMLASYMLSSEYALGALTGRVVPYFRHQEFTRDANTADLAVRSNDFGIHYVIHGHNARLTMEYSDTDTDTTEEVDSLKLGMQLQF
jgi:hypothetical protein